MDFIRSRQRGKRFAAIAIALAGTLLTPSLSQAAPVLTGSILVGEPFSPAECSLNPTCIAWTGASTFGNFLPVPGCQEGDPLAQRESMTSASIAQLPTGIAGTLRKITVNLKPTTGFSSGNGPSGAGVDFFTAACTRVAPNNPALPRPIKPGMTHSFFVPMGAKWIVVTGHQVIDMVWALT